MSGSRFQATEEPVPQGQGLNHITGAAHHYPLPGTTAIDGFRNEEGIILLTLPVSPGAG